MGEDRIAQWVERVPFNVSARRTAPVQDYRVTLLNPPVDSPVAGWSGKGVFLPGVSHYETRGLWRHNTQPAEILVTGETDRKGRGEREEGA